MLLMRAPPLGGAGLCLPATLSAASQEESTQKGSVQGDGAEHPCGLPVIDGRNIRKERCPTPVSCGLISHEFLACLCIYCLMSGL